MNKKIKYLTFIGICAVLLFLMAGCKNNGNVKKRNIVCLVDFSSSKNGDARQQFYRTVIKDNIIKNLAMTDRITILPLDAASLTNAEEILVKDVSAEDFTPEMAAPMEEEKITAENFEKYKARITSEFEQNFDRIAEDRKSRNQGTDIFGLLENLRNYIKPEMENNVIFLSDMMNYSKTLNMEPSNKNFNAANLEKLVKEAPPTDLQNAQILVLTGDQPDLPPAHFELIKNFWTKYFEQNKAQLLDFSSAAISRLNEIMSAKK